MTTEDSYPSEGTYEAPQVTVLGSVVELTLSGTGIAGDGIASGTQVNGSGLGQ